MCYIIHNTNKYLYCEVKMDDDYIFNQIEKLEDYHIKLQQAKSLQDESLKSEIYIQICKNEDIIDDLILELEKMSAPFYALTVLEELPNSEKFFDKKIKLICKILKKENVFMMNIEQAEFILQKAFSYKRANSKNYTYIDFLSQLDNDNLIIDLISLLKINNAERRDLYLLIQDDKLREKALLMISSKQELIEKFRPECINTIGLPCDISIGIELEAEGTMAIAFNNTIFFNDWKSKKERTLIHGVEVISPKLYDNKNDMQDLYLMTSLMKEFGLETSQRCGGHIHLGADYLDTKESFENLWLLWLQNEKIIYRLCNTANENFRDNVESFASPISKNFDGDKESLITNIKNCKTRDELVLVLKNSQRIYGKNSGISFNNINNSEKNTIEFRISNGTLDFEEIKNNICLYGRLFQRSKEMSIIQKKYNEGFELTKEEIKELQMFQTLCGSDLQEDDRANIFINFLFEESECEIYFDRYKKSNIDKIHFGKDSYKKFYEQLKSDDKKVPTIFEEFEKIDIESGDFIEY